MIGWLLVAGGAATFASSGPHQLVGSRLPGVAGPARSTRNAGGLVVDGARGATGRRMTVGRRTGIGSRRPAGPDLATVVTVVAGHLRAGSAPARAWGDVLAVPVVGRAPTVDELVGALGTGPEHRWRDGVGPRRSNEPASAVVAACRVADELGAPLATVLDEIAGALAADAEARADLVAALAGPRSGARVVGWLPVIGALLGVALGADPIGVLLGGGWPSLAGLVGVGLLVVGHLWTRSLVARAGRAGR